MDKTEARKFSFFPKMTNLIEQAIRDLDAEVVVELVKAIVDYGAYGIEPETDNMVVKFAFLGIKEDIDNSLAQRERNASNRQARQRQKDDAAQEQVRDETERPATTPNETERLATTSNEAERLATTSNETGRNGTTSNDPAPIPVHTSPVHTSPNQTKKREARRFTPPTLQEVRDHCAEKGYAFDPEAFWSFYESKGWKVGRNPMKSWQAACVTWQKREHEQPKGGAGDEYSNL